MAEAESRLPQKTIALVVYTKFNVPNPAENANLHALIKGGVVVYMVQAQSFGTTKTALAGAPKTCILGSKPDYFLVGKCKDKHQLDAEMAARCVQDFKTEAKKIGRDVSPAGEAALTTFFTTPWAGRTKIDRCMHRLVTMLGALGLNFNKDILLAIPTWVAASAQRL